MKEKLASIRAVVIDADGVLWVGSHFLPGVRAFFDFLSAHQIAFLILTNNATRPAADIIERLATIGVTIDERHVLTSAQATAFFLQRIAPRGARVLLVGSNELAHELTNAHYTLVDRDANVVVAGLDFALDYIKLKRAALEIRRGALFIATNSDKTYPTDEGLVPGAGAVLAALQAATDTAPIIVGKPERTMFELAVERMSVPSSATASLGDRLDTDIAGGQRAGLKSILVLTGVTTRETLSQTDIELDFVFDNLVALTEGWKKEYSVEPLSMVDVGFTMV